MRELTLEEKATNAETQEHRYEVQVRLNWAAAELIQRGLNHDLSKLILPEVEGFTAVTGKLKGMEYGTDEYRATLREIDPVIKHHYAHNRHHPEFHEGGIEAMSLIDLMEMMADWVAATKRMKDGGDIRTSFEKNVERFGIGPQLAHVLYNTVCTFPDGKS